MNIEYNNISKSYKNKIVLKDLNLRIPDKSIFFILGLNGAGKTTLLKITSNLLSYTGVIKFGLNKRPNIGAIIETPTFYENLSGYDNLKYVAIATGKNYSSIEAAMEKVGLGSKNSKAVKKYSLGMRQRLGIARAILQEPDILILDEPLNGLDPAGINEIKALIKNLNEMGMTIIVSSHLIRETADLATDYAILHEGKILVQFSDINKSAMLKCINIPLVGKIDAKAIEDILGNNNIIRLIFESNNVTILPTDLSMPTDSIAKMVENKIGHNIISYRDLQLDEYFLLLTKGGKQCLD